MPTVARTYRIHRTRQSTASSPKGYRHSVAAIDESSAETLARAEIAGRVTTATQTIVDAAERRWQLQPNRSVLPTRWTLSDDTQRVALHFDGEIARKLVRPLHRSALVVLDTAGAEILRVT